MNTRWLQLFLAASLAMLAYPAFAVQTLRLVSTGGAVNSQTSASLTIENGSSSSGFNAEIVLPNGVSLVEVAKGSLLATGQFDLKYVVTNQNLRVIVYSTTDTIGANGELLKLKLQISPNAPLGLQKLAFANTNTNPLINAKNALSSTDGLVSMPHNVQDGPFLIANTGNQTIVFDPPPTLVVNGIGTVSATGGASGNNVLLTLDPTSTGCSLGTNIFNGPKTWATITGNNIGTCVVNANQAGVGNYNAAPQVTQSFAVVNGLALNVTNANKTGGTVASNPVGIVCGATCSRNFASGTVVTLTSAPVSGTNISWGGACSGSATTCQVTLNTAQNVTVNFVPNYTLTVTNSNQSGGSVTSNVGGIVCGATCSQSYADGTIVTLIATPSSGYGIKWGGACSGSATKATTCPVTLNAAQSVTANFVPLYALTVTNANNTGGTVSSDDGGISCGNNTCSKSYVSGTVVTLTPKADNPWFFAGWSGVCHGKGATCQVTMDKAKSVTARFGAVRMDALAIDFNKPNGLWIRHANAVWEQLHPLTTSQLVSTDLDGNGAFDLVVDFKPYGIWAWMNRKEWKQLRDLSPVSITAADLDANASMELVAGFAESKKVNALLNNQQPWQTLFGPLAKSVTAVYLDENDWQDLLLDFAPYGLWQHLNNRGSEPAWMELDHNRSPGLSVVGDLDGNGHEDVVFSFGADGSWKWMNNSTWVKLHPLSPLGMVSADLDGNGMTDVAFNFGNKTGLWVFMNNQFWVQLHTLAPVTMAAAYLDNNNQQDVVIDFAPHGIWVYKNNLLWEKLINGPKSSRMVALPE